MLILLFLVHLVTKNGSAAPVALPLAPRSSNDSCDDINNCRKLFDIIWGCLVTIFACTWVSVHPNVPPPDQSRLARFWRRLKMMLIGIIAPEIMVGFAARQNLSVRKFAKKFQLSKTHGFFFCMGGFISSAGYPVVTKEQLEDPDLGPEFLKDIQKVRVEEIEDKSKGDVLSKGVALSQGIWFTAQCLARLHQHISITELEVATLAFAVVNIFIWLLWWNKPLDVQLAIIIGPPTSFDEQPIIPQPSQLDAMDGFLSAVFGTNENDDSDPPAFTSVPSFWSPPMGDKLHLTTVGITALAGSVFGAIHCAAWNTEFPTAAEMWIWRSSSLLITIIFIITFLYLRLGAGIAESAFGKTKIGNAINAILAVVFIFSFPIYILVRLILITLPFATLRSLPLSAFVDVNWSTYIPHI